MLNHEIEKAQRLVRTDAYQMSIGEIVSMYDTREMIIDPEFQRLFRWNDGQKSKLIESILLGIPLPSIFVFERDNGSWELIDGLQRLSTILEFMGKLRAADDKLVSPSILEATIYLPSLHNAVWEASDLISGVDVAEQKPIDKTQQLAIRRSRMSVEILKRPSDPKTKFDLFQRLNAGGTRANAQELRNCIMLMVHAEYYRTIKGAADQQIFRQLNNISDDQAERQRHMEIAVRFLVHTFIPYDGKLDIEDYIDQGIIALATAGEAESDASLITDTFQLLNNAIGENALRRYENGQYVSKVGLVGLESIAVGVAKNYQSIVALPNPQEFVRQRSLTFWAQPQAEGLTSPGLRGTSRIQRTVPFGEVWFRP